MDVPEKKSDAPNASHERISPTAWIVAYQRTLSDIPYAQEIFDELGEIMRKTRSAAELQELALLKNSENAPVFEARFKLANRLLEKSGIRQVLEIAAGFSPRGMKFAEDPSVRYVEIDLLNVMREKRAVIQSLIRQSKFLPKSNLRLDDGSALNTDDMLKATAHFKEGAVAVITEGLLRYLNLEEKTAVAKNVHMILKRFGGIWITPDLAIQGGSSGRPKETLKILNAGISRLTGIDFAQNRFESEDTVRTFFENLGFAVERHPFTEILDELTSPRRLNLSQDVAEETIGQRVVFVMRPKS